MIYLENLAREQNLTEIRLEARENALPFYQTIDYQIIKPSFLLFNSIQHFTMSKKL